MLRVGLVSAAGEKARGVLEVGLAGALGEGCEVRLWPTYAALVEALVAGDEEIAWLPPAAYLRARRRGGVRLLASVERGGKASYGCALVGRAAVAPTLEEAAGKRALWVDPWSAAGYLVPRALVRAAGHDPDTFFSSQGFAGDYRSLQVALIAGEADVVGFYARLDDDGEPVEGPWQGNPGLSVLAHGGPIPGDTLCSGPSLAEDRRVQLEKTLTGRLPPPALLVVLQATALRPPDAGAYDAFEARYAPP